MVASMSRNAVPPNGVLLGIDFGLARIGVARSDCSRLLASPCAIISRKVKPAADSAGSIMRQMAACGAVAVVMGWPDEEDERTREIRAAITGCIDQLEEHAVSVVCVSESFSSREALDLLHASGKKKKPGQYLDDWAAAVILQRYLDAPDEYTRK